MSLSIEVDFCITTPADALVCSTYLFISILAAPSSSKLGWSLLIHSGASANLCYWCVRERNEATPPLSLTELLRLASAGLRERTSGSGSIRKALLLWRDILTLTSVAEEAVSAPATTEAALENVALGPTRSPTSSRWPKTLSNGYCVLWWLKSFSNLLRSSVLMVYYGIDFGSPLLEQRRLLDAPADFT